MVRCSGWVSGGRTVGVGFVRTGSPACGEERVRDAFIMAIRSLLAVLLRTGFIGEPWSYIVDEEERQRVR